MELTALVSTNAIDRYMEVIDPDGMDARNFRKNPVVLWAHDYTQPPIGKALWIKKEGDGIVSKVKFANTPKGQEIFSLYKDGFMKAFSIGFIPIETENMQDDDMVDDPDMPKKPKKPKKIYKKWELLEYSAVPVPANPEAVALCVQRGLIKSEDAPAILERGFDNIDKWNEDITTGSAAGTTIPDADKKNSLGEMLDEINYMETKMEELNELLKSKDIEIGNLNLCIYNLNLKIKELEKTPGITAGELGEKIVDIASGVIRKHLGKVE